MIEYLLFPIEKKIIYIWIRHLQFEFADHIQYRGYKHIHNEIIVPIGIAFNHNEYNKILELCKEGLFYTKEATGNQFHMNLFIELEKMVNKFL